MIGNIERRAVLDMVGFDVEGRGHLAVRLAKATFVDGKMIDRGEPHRITFNPGDDIDAAMEIIGLHLEQFLHCERPSAADVAKLKAIAAIVWTPDAVEQHVDKWRRWEIENAEHCLRLGIPALSATQGREIELLQRISASLQDGQENVR